MTKILLTVVLICSMALAVWSKWIGVTCGKDCAIMALSGILSADIGWYFGVFATCVSGSALILIQFNKK